MTEKIAKKLAQQLAKQLEKKILIRRCNKDRKRD